MKSRNFAFGVVLAVACSVSTAANLHYSGNRRSDSYCAAYVPSLKDVAFTCRMVRHGSGPADIVVSMVNRSGCKVSVRGSTIVTGTNGHVFKSDALGNISNGYSFHETHQPFGWNLGSDGQEYPKLCAVKNVEICSQTPPPRYPSNSYFDPFRGGNCTRHAYVTRVTFKSPAKLACGRLAGSDWTSVNIPSRSYEQTIAGERSGMNITIQTSTAGHADQYSYTVPFGDIASVGNVDASDPGDGSDSGNIWFQITARAPFNSTSDGQAGTISYVTLVFPNASQAQEAHNYVSCRSRK